MLVIVFGLSLVACAVDWKGLDLALQLPQDASGDLVAGDVTAAHDVAPRDAVSGDAGSDGPTCNGGYFVVCVSAELADRPTGRNNWDPSSGGGGGGTRPDPFCQLEMPAGAISPQTTGMTDTLPDTLRPIWNQTISPPGTTIKAADLVSASKSWRIWVGDQDGSGAEVACEIHQPMSPSWLRDGGFTVQQIGSCVSLTVKLVCQGG